MSTDADVVVIGAGLAGLSAAWELHRAGLHPLVLEAAERPGGRIRTDIVDGFRLDRGFQLLNPSYPQIQRLARHGALDLDSLQLRSFDAGVRVALKATEAVLADPRRSPGDLLAAITAPIGSVTEKIAFAAWAMRAGTVPARRIIHGPDRPYGQTLSRWHIDGALRRGVIEPFLAGVLGEDETVTSTRFAELIIRSFVRGTPAVPALGMQALPDQLAAALPAGAIRYGVRVERLADASVHTAGGAITIHTDGGAIKARAVIVATDARAAVTLTGIPMPAMRALTTFWFAADHAPLSRPILSVDGLRRGPIVNAAVMSQAAPSYTSDRRALIACTILGLPGPASEASVREQADLIYATSTGDATSTSRAASASYPTSTSRAASASYPTSASYATSASGWQLLRVDAIADALPAMTAPLAVSPPSRLRDGVFLAGDHRATASQQGALASGAQAAAEAIAGLGGSINS